MEAKSVNLNRILRQILPSGFFILLFVLNFIFSSSISVVEIIAGAVVLILLANIFLQNKIVNQVLGIIFLLGSLYLTLALFDDVIDGVATIGYLAGGFLILVSIIMSVLLILSYKKKEQS